MIERVKQNRIVRKLVFSLTKKGREKLRKEEEWYADFDRRNGVAEYLKKSICDPAFADREKYIDEISYIENKGKATLYNYSWCDKYYAMNIDVFYDEDKGMHYVMHNEKKLFFPKGLNEDAVREGYRFLCLEQDTLSPHRYLCSDFSVCGGTFMDVGCAEAMTSLDVLDIVDRLVLFENDNNYIECVRATFENYMHKVEIVPLLVSSENIEGVSITLENYVEKAKCNNPLWIKMDVEGMEMDVLNGARGLICDIDDIHFACTTYHNQNDAQIIKIFFDSNMMTNTFSQNYMLFTSDSNQYYPFFRHGLIYAQKAKGVLA